MILISYPIQAQPKARPRFTKKGHVYTPKTTKQFEMDIQFLTGKYLRDCCGGLELPMIGPVNVSIHFYIKRPKTVKREYPCVKPDLDNLAKSVLDAVNGFVFKDDAQICDLKLRKEYVDYDPKIVLYCEPSRYQNHYLKK